MAVGYLISRKMSTNSGLQRGNQSLHWLLSRKRNTKNQFYGMKIGEGRQLPSPIWELYRFYRIKPKITYRIIEAPAKQQT